MSQFPVTDTDGTIEAINYLLSGPTSSGQNFQGFSTDEAGYLTGNFRVPYVFGSSNLTVAPIALGNSSWLDPVTWRHDFAVAQASPPFANGNNITVSGVTPVDYNGTYSRIGVVECTTTYVIARATSPYPDPGVVGTGGTVELSTAIDDQETWYSTDCNAKVTVTGGTDRVFISSQLNTQWNATINSLATVFYTVAINRYKGFPNNDPTNPEYLFNPDKTVAKQVYPTDMYATTSGGYATGVATATVGQVPVSNPLQLTYFVPNADATIGTGQGANLNITIAANAVTQYDASNTLITVAGGDAGENYLVGDVIVILGSRLGGVDGVNDLTITVTAIEPSYIYQNPNVETIFTTVIDNPPPGYYWYIMEVQWFVAAPVTGKVMSALLGFRNLTAQLIKS